MVRLGACMGDPVDQQPKEGGAKERGEGGQEQSFHEHRKGRGPAAAAGPHGGMGGWWVWRPARRGSRAGVGGRRVGGVGWAVEGWWDQAGGGVARVEGCGTAAPGRVGAPPARRLDRP